MVVRDPYEALQAEFNREYSNNNSHTGHASISVFKQQGGKDWRNFVYSCIVKWANTNTYWYNSFPEPSTRHVIFYDELVNDTENVLHKVLEFLNIDITKKAMKCVVEQKEGLYHRSKKKLGIELFDTKMKRTVNDTKDRVYKLLRGDENNTMLSSTTEVSSL